MGFFTNIDQQTTAGPIRRRVSSIFGDTQPDGRYYEPQKITDDTLMDVSDIFLPKLFYLDYFSLLRVIIMIH